MQNARQKQRKIYENQPNNSFYESEEKKPNINYTCKKCNLVFQRYYELIRHQKNHCFKEENNKKSAKAQIAAAQIAQSLSSEDSNSSMDINSSCTGGPNTPQMLSTTNLVVAAAAAAAAAAAQQQQNSLGGTLIGVGGGGGSQNLTLGSPNMGISAGSRSNATSPSLNMYKNSCMSPQSSSQQPDQQQQQQHSSMANKFECEKCNLTFARLDQYKEHQLIHIMNPSLFLNQQMLNQSYAENSPFGILQNLSAAGGNNNALDNSVDLSHKKRKYSESSDADAQDYESLNKRVKNEQYEFLMNYFMQNEQNDDLKKQQTKHTMDFDALYQYYQMSEMKKKGMNFDYLYQYYLQNENKQQSTMSPNSNNKTDELNSNDKPNLDFLLQYYQINETKKFFQLDASPPQTKPDSSSLQTTMMLQMINNLQQKQQQQQQQSNVTSLSNTSQTGGSGSATSAASKRAGSTISNSNASSVQNCNNNTTSKNNFVGGASSAAMANSISSTSSNTSSTASMNDHSFNTNSELTVSTPSTVTATEKQNNKRLRTTILPEQLNFLYECYQNESNPSRKMLEEISKKVNLKKRVVQVGDILATYF